MNNQINKWLEKKRLKDHSQSPSFTDFEDFISLVKRLVPKRWESIEVLLKYLRTEHGLRLPLDPSPQISQQLKSDNRETQEIMCKVIKHYLLKEPLKYRSYETLLSAELLEASLSVKKTIFRILEQLTRRNHHFSLKTITNLTAILYKGESWSAIQNVLSLLRTQKWFTLQQKNLISQSCGRIITSQIPKEQTQVALILLEQLNPHLKSPPSKKHIKHEQEVIIIKHRFNVREYMDFFGVSFKEFQEEYKQSLIITEPELKEKYGGSYRLIVQAAHIIPVFIERGKNKRKLYEYDATELKALFHRPKKISLPDIKAFFEFPIEFPKISETLTKLLKIGIIQGYFNVDFYPSTYIKKQFLTRLKSQNKLELSDYIEFPESLIEDIVRQIESESDELLFYTRDRLEIYPLSGLVSKVEREANVKKIINLTYLRSILKEDTYNLLIESSAKKGLIFPTFSMEKNATYLTLSGKEKIKRHLEKLKALNVGYIELRKLAEKLTVNLEIIKALMENYIDPRSGIYNKDKSTFYFNRYIFKMSTWKKEEQQRFSDKMNKSLDEIYNELEENQTKILNELKLKKDISLPPYLSKLGLNRDEFTEKLSEMNIAYVIEGERLLLEGEKFDNYLQSVKQTIVKIAQRKNDFLISQGKLQIPEYQTCELIKDLLREGKIKGILYKKYGRYRFSTRAGLLQRLSKKKHSFSVQDLFPAHNFAPPETKLIKTVMEELIEKEILSGDYDPEKMTFNSDTKKAAEEVEGLKKLTKMILDLYGKAHIILKILIDNINSDGKTQLPLPIQEKSIKQLMNYIIGSHKSWSEEFNRYLHDKNNPFLKSKWKEWERLQTRLKAKSELKPSEKKKKKILANDRMLKEIKDLKKEILSMRATFNYISAKYESLLYFKRKYQSNPLNKKAKSQYEQYLKTFKLNNTKPKPRLKDKVLNIAHNPSSFRKMLFNLNVKVEKKEDRGKGNFYPRTQY